MRQTNDRHLFQPELRRGQYASVAGNDRPLSIDQYRVDEAELGNRLGDLPDLFVGVGAGVAHIGAERRDGQPFNGQFHDCVPFS